MYTDVKVKVKDPLDQFELFKPIPTSNKWDGVRVLSVFPASNGMVFCAVESVDGDIKVVHRDTLKVHV